MLACGWPTACRKTWWPLASARSRALSSLGRRRISRVVPATPHDLASHRCIRNRLASGALWRWEFSRQGEVMSLDVDGSATLDDNGLRLQAALGGLGLVYMNAWSAGPHLQAGRLVQVRKDWTPSIGQLALYYPGHRHVPMGLRAFVELLREVDARP